MTKISIRNIIRKLNWSESTPILGFIQILVFSILIILFVYLFGLALPNIFKSNILLILIKPIGIFFFIIMPLYNIFVGIIFTIRLKAMLLRVIYGTILNILLIMSTIGLLLNGINIEI